MSFEGYHQSICTQGHYYTTAYDYSGEQRGNATYYNCPICGSKPQWSNIVDDTNCDSYGLVHVKTDENDNVLRMPSPHKGVWESPQGDFEVICKNRHYYEASHEWKPCSGRLRELLFPNCPICAEEPIWTNKIGSINPTAVVLQFTEGNQITFEHLPEFNQGVWSFIEGGDAIDVEDLEQFFGIKDLKRFAHDRQIMGVAFAIADSYPHQWQISVAHAVKVFEILRRLERDKRLKKECRIRRKQSLVALNKQYKRDFPEDPKPSSAT